MNKIKIDVPVIHVQSKYTTIPLPDRGGTQYQKHVYKTIEYPDTGSRVERTEKSTFIIYDKVHGQILKKEIDE